MNRVFRGAPLVALLVLILAACSPSGPPGAADIPATPEKTILTAADLLKKGDIKGFLQLSLPPAEYARMKADWTEHKDDKPITDEDRHKFAEAMTKLTAPDAEQTLFAEFEPQLREYDAEAKQKMPMLVGMGRGWLQGMVQQSETLTDGEKAQAMAAINAIADWVQATRFTDPDLVRKVLAIACRVARDVNVKTLDEARALDFDQSTQKAQIVFLGLKEALAVYGLSLDATLDSVKPKVLSSKADKADVRISYMLLSTPLQFETHMQRLDGRWYGEKTLKEMGEHQVEAAGNGATPAAPAATTLPDATPGTPSATPQPARD